MLMKETRYLARLGSELCLRGVGDRGFRVNLEGVVPLVRMDACGACPCSSDEAAEAGGLAEGSHDDLDECGERRDVAVGPDAISRCGGPRQGGSGSARPEDVCAT